MIFLCVEYEKMGFNVAQMVSAVFCARIIMELLTTCMYQRIFVDLPSFMR